MNVMKQCMLVSIRAALVTLASQLLLLNNALADSETSEPYEWQSDWEAHNGDDEFITKCRVHVSDIKQCIFVTETDTPIAVLVAAVSDVERFTEWAESVSVSKRLPQLESTNDTVVYTEYAFSGAYDRFAVTRYQTDVYAEAKRVQVQFLTMDDAQPPEPTDLLRFPLMTGYWQFEETETGMTRIEHKSLTLPGGSVQNTLSYFYNRAYIDASYDTIRNLIEFANTEPYINASIEWVEESALQN